MSKSARIVGTGSYLPKQRISNEKKYLFFIGAADIYWVDAKFIEGLKPDHIK